jgi:glycosyltransferase involved in cell wall biosynthesis
MQVSPRFSLIIPAYNEAARLPALLDSVDIARANYRGGAAAIEVIVGNNVSTDDTAAIALARGCKVATVEKRRIAAARNGGAALATGEVVCFIDGDSTIHPQTFNVVDDTIGNPRVIVGATSADPERWSPGIWLTWLIATIITWFAKVDTGVVFCRRADFLEIGGYDESLEYAEDIKFLSGLKKLGRTRGQHFARADTAKAVTSTRKFDTHGDWHYFTKMPRVGFWMLINKTRVKRFTDQYWYQDR